VKTRGNHPVSGIARSAGRCIASFYTVLLDATFAVSFPENLSGAVALHRFVSMIEREYGKPVELRNDDSFPVNSKAVEELLQSMKKAEPVFS
jgi:hypothetical protein